MKRLLFAAALTLAAIPAFAADVGFSISMGQPDFFGRIDIGGFPQPQVVHQQPRVIYRSAINRQPIYMNVPPGHAKNWREHCRTYNACGERVYFVQNTWYSQEYVPHFQKQHGDRRDNHRNDHRGKQNDRHDNDRGNDHGQGRGH